MNENQRIDNPRIKIVKCFDALKMKKLNHYKNNWHNFQYTKFSVIELALCDRRNLSGKRPKSACGKSSSCQFSFSATRNAITKATEYVTFGFSFRILVLFSPLGRFERHCLWAIRILQFFSSLNPKDSEKQSWIGNGKGFAVHSSTWPSGAKGEWRVSSWLAISNTRENISYFFTCVVSAFPA